MSITLIVALCDTTLWVYPFSGGACVPVHLTKFECLLLRGDVKAHIGGASELTQTEILHIYLDSPFPGCQRKMYEDGRESATFPFSEIKGYPTKREIAKELARELAQEQELLGESLGKGKRRRGGGGGGQVVV